MKKFELVSEQLKDFKEGISEDIMYEIKGNTDLIKKIIIDKISCEFDPLHLESNLIKQLNVYVTNGFENTTEIWLDVDKNNDLYFIYKNPEIKIDDVESITKIIINWLLG